MVKKNDCCRDSTQEDSAMTAKVIDIKGGIFSNIISDPSVLRVAVFIANQDGIMQYEIRQNYGCSPIEIADAFRKLANRVESTYAA